MFHRVKSEVQESDQVTQQKADLPYRREESEKPRESNAAYAESVTRPAEEKADSPFAAPKPRYVPEVRKDNVMAESRKKEAVEEDVDMQDDQDNALAGFRGYEAPAAAYRRPSFQPPAAPQQPPAPSSYPGSYRPSQDLGLSAEERTLTIGRGINMSGEIEACDHLLVEGTVEAALKGAKVLEIAESGTFYGTVEIEEATIAGRFEGDITVNGRLTIRASGAITGSIAYRELEVEAGAMLDGRMTPLREPVDPKRIEQYKTGTEASAMAKAKELSSKKDNREPANTESRLFSKARA